MSIQPPTCPVTCPTPCGPGEMRCSGGMDANGCMMPDTCIPAFGKYRICFLFLVCKKLQFNQKIAADGVDGVKCPNVCPVPCGLEEVFCPGGLMPQWVLQWSQVQKGNLGWYFYGRLLGWIRVCQRAGALRYHVIIENLLISFKLTITRNNLNIKSIQSIRHL